MGIDGCVWHTLHCTLYHKAPAHRPMDRHLLFYPQVYQPTAHVLTGSFILMSIGYMRSIQSITSIVSDVLVSVLVSKCTHKPYTRGFSMRDTRDWLERSILSHTIRPINRIYMVRPHI
jgi:hypothetical protein